MATPFDGATTLDAGDVIGAPIKRRGLGIGPAQARAGGAPAVSVAVPALQAVTRAQTGAIGGGPGVPSTSPPPLDGMAAPSTPQATTTWDASKVGQPGQSLAGQALDRMFGTEAERIAAWNARTGEDNPIPAPAAPPPQGAPDASNYGHEGRGFGVANVASSPIASSPTAYGAGIGVQAKPIRPMDPNSAEGKALLAGGDMPDGTGWVRAGGKMIGINSNRGAAPGADGYEGTAQFRDAVARGTADKAALSGYFQQHLAAGDLDGAMRTASSPAERAQLGALEAHVVEQRAIQAQMENLASKINDPSTPPDVRAAMLQQYQGQAGQVKSWVNRAAALGDQQTAQQKAEMDLKGAGVGIQEKQADLAGKNLTLQQQKDLTALYAKFSAETDPAKRQAMAEEILARTGKDKPDHYKVASGGTILDPANPAAPATKTPDRIFDTHTGKYVEQSGLGIGTPSAPRVGSPAKEADGEYDMPGGKKATVKGGVIVAIK